MSRPSPHPSHYNISICIIITIIIIQKTADDDSCSFNDCFSASDPNVGGLDADADADADNTDTIKL